MTVQDFMELAIHGELQQLPIKDNEDVIISFINLGIIELYKRFNLKTEEYLLELQDNTTLYKMPNDFMYILTAYEEMPEGASDYDAWQAEIPVNEGANPRSINTVSYNTIQVPLSIDGSYVSIIYAATPETITIADLGDELDIPNVLIEALLNYVGYRGHSAVNSGMEGEGNVHWSKFERSCNTVKELGIAIAPDSLDSEAKLTKRGFV